MNLHIELDRSHPAYAWLEKQADKLGARGHFGMHIDSYGIGGHGSEHREWDKTCEAAGCCVVEISGSLPRKSEKSGKSASVASWIIPRRAAVYGTY